MKTKMKKGFTLVELLVVIAIIAILASVILVSLSAQRQNARQSSVLQSAKSLLPAVMQCQLQKEVFKIPSSVPNYTSIYLQYPFDANLDSVYFHSFAPAGYNCYPEIRTKTPALPSFCQAYPTSMIRVFPSTLNHAARGALYFYCYDGSLVYNVTCCYEGRDSGRCTTDLSDVTSGNMQCF